jgi:hypothetical protein
MQTLVNELEELNREFTRYYTTLARPAAASSVRSDKPSALDVTALQVARYNQIRADAARLVDSAYRGDFATDYGKWSVTAKEDLADLTDTTESTYFARAGVGARDGGGSISPHAALEAQDSYLRDKVWPKLREGMWGESPFCERARELEKRPSDSDVEKFIIDRIELGYELRTAVRSTQPPDVDAVTRWVDGTDQGFRDRAETTLSDRFKRGEDAHEDEIEAPMDWKARSAFIDRRISALFALLREQRELR